MRKIFPIGSHARCAKANSLDATSAPRRKLLAAAAGAAILSARFFGISASSCGQRTLNARSSQFSHYHRPSGGDTALP